MFRNLALGPGTHERLLEVTFAQLAHCVHIGCLVRFRILMETPRSLSTSTLPQN